MSQFSRILGVVRGQLSAFRPLVRGFASDVTTGSLPSAETKTTSGVTTTTTKPTEDLGPAKGLMEFFDVKENWAVNEVRVGRSWRKEELRIKSNSDLHKLWYVLLKERNMLLTMLDEYNANVEAFPSPERIDKVHESMVNLEEVVRERNKAYHLLETGETGERPGHLAVNPLGMQFFFKTAEHVVPPEHNNHWFKTRRLGCDRREVAQFRLYYNEKLWLEKLRDRRRQARQVMRLYRHFPDIDEEALQATYPDVNLEKVKRWRGVQGHYLPKNG